MGRASPPQQRASNIGSSEPLLDDIQQALLWQALQEPPGEGGQWNGRKVADWIGELIGRPVSRQRGWEYLKQMRFRLRVPRPEHTESRGCHQLVKLESAPRKLNLVRELTPRRYALRDDQWERLKDLLPGREGTV